MGLQLGKKKSLRERKKESKNIEQVPREKWDKYLFAPHYGQLLFFWFDL